MSPQQLIALVLGLAIAAASLRLLAGVLRMPRDTRPRAWRIAAVLALQGAVAASLFLTLHPPKRAVPAGTLVVLTQGADGARAVREGAQVVRLPEAPAGDVGERVPDLATALRRHPGSTRLHVLGAGLVARDGEAAASRPLSFTPDPLPRGIVELWSPPQVQAGNLFQVRGRAAGVPAARVELLDPAGDVADRATIDAAGDFALAGLAATDGPVTFRLRLSDAEGGAIEQADLPLHVTAPGQRRILLLAGAPSPEFKFLQRWALDTGATVHGQVELGGGIRIGDGPVAFDADSLGRFEVAVLDERVLQGLGGPAHAALVAAVRDGLGLVVRITGPLAAAGRARLRALGFRLDPADTPAAVVLPRAPPAARPRNRRDAAADADAAPEAAADALPPLSRRPLRVASDDGIALVRDRSGAVLAMARNEGRGRVAAWIVSDTHRLVLSGHATAHARLWSDALAWVARPVAMPGPVLRGEARAGERAAACGLERGARLQGPAGRTVPLRIDPAIPGACAALWPATSGWHTVESGAQRLPFHVRDAAALPGVQARALRDRTRQLAASARPQATVPDEVPGPRWPWFLAFLAGSGVLWWLERARLGRTPGRAAG